MDGDTVRQARIGLGGMAYRPWRALAAEAALVGGLADWFAVTALFRQPLGLPIPHTAILPKNKDRIGEGLAIFIERNFLSPDILRAKLRSIDPARLVAPGAAQGRAGTSHRAG